MNFWAQKFNSAGALGYLNWMPDKLYLKILFRLRMGYRLNLKSPRTFSEKLQWMKLYDRKPIYNTMVDKAEAKKYVAERIGDEYIIPTLGVWERFEDIDFDTLPDRFVLKCTHDSGGLAICRDKATFDKQKAKEKIERSLRANYFLSTREWPYKDVKPRILAEQYVEDFSGEPLIDYKFYCFDGEPKCLYVSKGLTDHKTAQISFVTMDWQQAPYSRNDYPPFDSLPLKPKKFHEMVDVCRTLARGHAFLRVDLYQINDRVYFSELTFSPCAGFMKFDPPEWDKTFGDWITLPTDKKN